MQGISAKARLVCWTNLTSWVLTPFICDLPIRVCDAAVALLRLGRSLALPTRATSSVNTYDRLLSRPRYPKRHPQNSFRPRIAHGDLAL